MEHALIACQCNVVTDHTIFEAIDAGATTIADIGAACRAGTDCGGCHRTLHRLLDTARAVDDAFEQVTVTPVAIR